MSGPININVTLPGQWSYREYFVTVAPPYPYTTINTLSGRCVEPRPASHSVHRDASGWRAPTPWSHSYQRVDPPYVDIAYEYVDRFGRTVRGDGHGYPYFGLPDLLPIGQAEDLAVNQALLKLSNQQTDLGENFAEREQADRMIAERIDRYTSQLTGRYIARHRRDWRVVKKVSPFVRHGMKYPQSWLEFQYGILPLLNDIHGAYNLMKNVDKENNSFRVTAKGFVQNDPVFSRLVSTLSPGVRTWFSDLHYNEEKRSAVFVRLDYCMVNPALHELQQVGLVNPALLAWNLLPYSFVVDWALPVGDYLQAWTAALGLRFLGGSISRYQKSKRSAFTAEFRSGQSTSGNHLKFWSSNALGGGATTFAMSRSVLTTSPAPRVPHFKNPLTLGHTANALSLLVQALQS